MKFKCPECNAFFATLVGEKSDQNEKTEIWQCDDCEALFVVYYEIVKIKKLVEVD